MALNGGISPSGGAILKGPRTQHPWRACGLEAVRYYGLPLLPQPHLIVVRSSRLPELHKEDLVDGRRDQRLVDRPDAR
jgi:hypothetical protein